MVDQRYPNVLTASQHRPLSRCRSRAPPALLDRGDLAPYQDVLRYTEPAPAGFRDKARGERLGPRPESCGCVPSTGRSGLGRHHDDLAVRAAPCSATPTAVDLPSSAAPCALAIGPPQVLVRKTEEEEPRERALHDEASPLQIATAIGTPKPVTHHRDATATQHRERPTPLHRSQVPRSRAPGARVGRVRSRSRNGCCERRSRRRWSRSSPVVAARGWLGERLAETR